MCMIENTIVCPSYFGGDAHEFQSPPLEARPFPIASIAVSTVGVLFVSSLSLSSFPLRSAAALASIATKVREDRALDEGERHVREKHLA